MELLFYSVNYGIKIAEYSMNEEVEMSIPLVEVLDALREDLKKAQENSDPKNPLLIEEIEVELQAVVTKGGNVDGEVGGKVSIGILDFLKLGEVDAKLKASGKWEKATTQKIKLKLSAVTVADDGSMKKTTVNDEDDY